MSIELRGGGCYVSMHASSWDAIQKIAREYGWVPKYVKPPKKPGFFTGPRLTENSARALATALYRAIHEVEADCLSKPLVKLVKEVQIANLRDVADMASVSGFWID